MQRLEYRIAALERGMAPSGLLLIVLEEREVEIGRTALLATAAGIELIQAPNEAVERFKRRVLSEFETGSRISKARQVVWLNEIDVAL